MKVRIDGSFDDWQPRRSSLRDTLGDPAHRRHSGWQGEPEFVNETGRNDLMAAKVAPEGEFVDFYVKTRRGPDLPGRPLDDFADRHRRRRPHRLARLRPRREPREAGQRHGRASGRLKSDGSREDRDRVAAIAFSGSELELTVPLGAGCGRPQPHRAGLQMGRRHRNRRRILGSHDGDGDAAPNDRFANFSAA